MRYTLLRPVSSRLYLPAADNIAGEELRFVDAIHRVFQVSPIYGLFDQFRDYFSLTKSVEAAISF